MAAARERVRLDAVARQQRLEFLAKEREAARRREEDCLRMEQAAQWRAEAEARRQEEERLRRLAERPTPRLIRKPEDAEKAAAEWMRYMRFTAPRCTRSGADGGIDVTSKEAVAQVKMEGKATGRPALQRLHGAASPLQRQALFFSLNGYTKAAQEWANTARMALLVFDYQGEPKPVNALAREIMKAADRGVGSY